MNGDNAYRLSVIVPVYNIEAYILRCLRSIACQTADNDTRRVLTVTVDDGSADGCGALCDGFALRDATVISIHKKNAGVSSARNAGLDLCDSEFVTFCDGDDFLEPDTYENLLQSAKREGADISIGSFFYDREGQLTPYCDSQTRPAVYEGDAQQVCLLKNRPYTCSVWDRVFRRSVIGNIRFDTGLAHYEDLVFLWKVNRASSLTAFDPKPYYHYVMRESSASHEVFTHRKMDMITAYDMIYADLSFCGKELRTTVKHQFVRNNVMIAAAMARTGYGNRADIKRVRRNIRHGLFGYVFGKSAFGYKVYAVCVSLSWSIFTRIVR